MSNSLSVFPYQTRVLELPPLVAQAAFDEVRRARHRTGPLWEVAVPGGRLELRGSGRVSPPPRPCYWSYREVRGWVLTRWHSPIPVRLELVPWSATTSALGLSLAGPPLLGLSESVYLEMGGGALAVLARELDAWALEELHELEAELRRAG